MKRHVSTSMLSFFASFSRAHPFLARSLARSRCPFSPPRSKSQQSPSRGGGGRTTPPPVRAFSKLDVAHLRVVVVDVVVADSDQAGALGQPIRLHAREDGTTVNATFLVDHNASIFCMIFPHTAFKRPSPPPAAPLIPSLWGGGLFLNIVSSPDGRSSQGMTPTIQLRLAS